ncbi:sister chromatid cohesion 1 protein 4-like isoform X2 [Carica papaya]|uniref:sister chromatid cohesion 1 protein 4-like isoform X2 n=1 Tax=Carica papaya TaxID=3649 RepID=UPI000B8C9879|nr:sister chromatid cohesion 1 protein 4-like isoform X2 [Carica papaya]
MFYSQFILAKKGPLGTIWIAAHLERKLRKNQVADTDIGVSVDSILFPEIPIALRLSSHLLLGVVRIYSRKVNYLFDDCSEALLKIKQAFRSTAVDLPPEESTAPYHSITLPETFDLDDFELPENEIFQGNYVDRHISTREQITLQDTMDGVVYSTSQFGLDERFGDGDTSQIGLDLEEDMYLDKRGTGNDGVSDDPQASAEARIIMSEKAAKDKGVTGAPETMAVDGNGQEVGALPATSEYDEYAQAPSTPGLVEVSNLSSVQKALACDDQMESEDHTVTDLVAIEGGENAANKVDLDQRGKSAIDWSFQNDLHNDSTEYVPPDDGVSPSNTMDGEKHLHNGAVSSIDRTGAEFVESPCCSHVTSEVEDVGQASNMPETHNGEVPNNVKESCTYEKELVSHVVCASESPGRPTVIDAEIHACKETKNPDNLNDSVLNGETSLASKDGLQPCSSSLSQPDLPSPGIVEACLGETARSQEALHSSGALTEQGEGCRIADVIQSEDNQMANSISHDEIQFNSRMLDKQQPSVLASDSQLEILNKSTASDFPTAEKVLSLPEELGDKPKDFVVDSTPDKAVVAGADGVDDTTKHISGKKRSFTESTLTVESFNSVESVGLTLSKRTAESIPDDDDLLSSILVGRRSSALRMKPSQPLEVVSIKRTRSAPRSTLSKRKVLMDDTMVVHGDIIRQQLTNTEDIRRIRKKAPCTHPEILMIQRQFLEEEIFLEPIATGMSAELVSLHSERYDLSRTKVSEIGENCASSEVVKDVECSIRLDVVEKSGMLGSAPIICGNDVQVQPDETLIQAETQQSKEREFDMQCQTGAISDVYLDSLQHEPLGEKSDMEIDGRGNAMADEVNHFAYRELEMASLTGVIPEDISEIPHGGRTDITSTSMGMDLSCEPSDWGVDGQPVEKGGL